MVVGLIGAVLTAAYMTRCVYLTFFGEYRGHAAPARVAARDHRAARRARRLQHRRRPRERDRVRRRGVREVRRADGRVPGRCSTPDFDITLAAVSFFLVIIALGVAHRSSGSTARSCAGSRASPSAAARRKAGHLFLVNKYYLDDLYEDTIVGGIKGPIARASYWVNQNVIDGVVNAVGRGSAALGRLTYRYVDQDVVDGAVNGIANETGNAGGLLTYVQSGRVQRYALILFGSVGVLAVLLVIFS